MLAVMALLVGCARRRKPSDAAVIAELSGKLSEPPRIREVLCDVVNRCKSATALATPPTGASGRALGVLILGCCPAPHSGRRRQLETIPGL